MSFSVLRGDNSLRTDLARQNDDAFVIRLFHAETSLQQFLDKVSEHDASASIGKLLKHSYMRGGTLMLFEDRLRVIQVIYPPQEPFTLRVALSRHVALHRGYTSALRMICDDEVRGVVAFCYTNLAESIVLLDELICDQERNAP